MLRDTEIRRRLELQHQRLDEAYQALAQTPRGSPERERAIQTVGFIGGVIAAFEMVLGELLVLGELQDDTTDVCVNL